MTQSPDQSMVGNDGGHEGRHPLSWLRIPLVLVLLLLFGNMVRMGISRQMPSATVGETAKAVGDAVASTATDKPASDKPEPAQAEQENGTAAAVAAKTDDLVATEDSGDEGLLAEIDSGSGAGSFLALLKAVKRTAADRSRQAASMSANTGAAALQAANASQDGVDFPTAVTAQLPDHRKSAGTSQPSVALPDFQQAAATRSTATKAPRKKKPRKSMQPAADAKPLPTNAAVDTVKANRSATTGSDADRTASAGTSIDRADGEESSSESEPASGELAASVDASVPLVLSNRAENRLPVHFVLDGEVHNLQPGEWHRWEVRGEGKLDFHRGGKLGYAQQRLSAGSYEFQVNPDGWQVVRVGPLPVEAPQQPPTQL